MKIIEHTINTHFLPALINDDRTGLDHEDQIAFDAWLASVRDNAAHWDFDIDTINNTYFTRCSISDLMGDCAIVKQVCRGKS